jgi:hypothetical protein
VPLLPYQNNSARPLIATETDVDFPNSARDGIKLFGFENPAQLALTLLVLRVFADYAQYTLTLD